MSARTPAYQRVPKGAIGFRPEFLDFKRGIRVGNLEENERITRLLKSELEHRCRQPFVTERRGKGGPLDLDRVPLTCQPGRQTGLELGQFRMSEVLRDNRQ